MLRGLGNDIIEVSRVQRALERHGQRFLDKLFTSEEQRYCQSHRESARHYAGRFAAKEAIVKALGTGFVGISWTDLEVRNDPNGKPVVYFSERFQNQFSSPQILLSISHCHEYATAVAIWVG